MQEEFAPEVGFDGGNRFGVNEVAAVGAVEIRGVEHLGEFFEGVVDEEADKSFLDGLLK